MVKFLRVRGWPSEYLFNIDYPSKDMPNVLAAESYLSPAIGNLLRQAERACQAASENCRKFEQVDIVAHSMGAVSSRWYATQMHPERVRTWISLVGANHGSASNCPGPPESGKRDLCPAYAQSMAENPVQFALNGGPGPDVDESPFGIGQDSPGVRRVSPDSTRKILYLTLRVKNDRFVHPESSPMLDGAGGSSPFVTSGMNVTETAPGNYLVTIPMDHDGLPTTRLAARFVEAALLAAR